MKKKSAGVLSSGFTLMELMVVVVIIGILASIAIPRYTKLVETSRASEGVHILGAVRGAQKVYYARSGTYSAEGAWNDPISLAVDFEDRKYFDWVPMPNTATYGCPNPSIGRVQRNGTSNSGWGSYLLCMRADGTIDCANGSNGICAALGY